MGIENIPKQENLVDNIVENRKDIVEDIENYNNKLKKLMSDVNKISEDLPRLIAHNSHVAEMYKNSIKYSEETEQAQSLGDYSKQGPDSNQIEKLSEELAMLQRVIALSIEQSNQLNHFQLSEEELDAAKKTE